MPVVITNLSNSRVGIGRFVIASNSSVTLDRTDFLPREPGVPNSLSADLDRMQSEGLIEVVYNDILVNDDVAGSLDSTDAEVEHASVRIVVAAGTPDEVVLMVADGDLQIVAARLIENVGVTANDTNFATLSIENQTASNQPAVNTTEITATGGTGDVAQWAAADLTLGSARGVSSGDVITAAVAHTGAGVAIDALFQVSFVRSA